MLGPRSQRLQGHEQAGGCRALVDAGVYTKWPPPTADGNRAAQRNSPRVPRREFQVWPQLFTSLGLRASLSVVFCGSGFSWPLRFLLTALSLLLTRILRSCPRHLPLAEVGDRHTCFSFPSRRDSGAQLSAGNSKCGRGSSPLWVCGLRVSRAPRFRFQFAALLPFICDVSLARQDPLLVPPSLSFRRDR
ncbi:hypothetical protein NDU88_006671 [Pleurodeles waltl]|uniref:Uncharacterized protein n=1 Tax=Pleurodeles waltl TaxID=8319 RepID=A0AAV7UN68_PLEWA|nr:hypothetical protein NDU88_006671 [Pleurodeles waltl]